MIRQKAAWRFSALGLGVVYAVSVSAPAQARLPSSGAGSETSQPDPAFAARCASLARIVDPLLGQIDTARPGASMLEPTRWNPAPAPLPRHCEVFGTLQPREGLLGQHYAIRYHMRLPDNWNGRFLLQGGAGSNGEIGDATGPAGPGAPSAILRGFAVISHDSGHDNHSNDDPAHGGVLVFGTDPQARANYGHASLPLVTGAGKALVQRFYGKPATRSYFFGCSKGGQEGMALSHRYPDLFDGIVAGAPGFALPRAALNQAWSLQQLAALARNQTGTAVTPEAIARSFSAADLQLVRGAVLAACDKSDGIVDGITGNIAACTAGMVLPQLRATECKLAKSDDCLGTRQVDTFARIMEGPLGRSGRPIYSRWAMDAGLGTPAWSMWRLGNPQMPAMDITLGAPSLATVFTVPPEPVGNSPQALLGYALSLKFPEAEGLIYARDARYPLSAWQDIAMRSPDVDGMVRHHGKLLVYHGAADPVFSLLDTVGWWDEVRARYGVKSDASIRLFAVPGMAHCAGGPGTDMFDMLGVLVDWVEAGKAPAKIVAMAGPSSPWPGRSRPLCAWPQYASYISGNPEQADSFRCTSPPKAASSNRANQKLHLRRMHSET